MLAAFFILSAVLAVASAYTRNLHLGVSSVVCTAVCWYLDPAFMVGATGAALLTNYFVYRRLTA